MDSMKAIFSGVAFGLGVALIGAVALMVTAAFGKFVILPYMDWLNSF